jgi:hypothetical protein
VSPAHEELGGFDFGPDAERIAAAFDTLEIDEELVALIRARNAAACERVAGWMERLMGAVAGESDAGGAPE